MKNIIIFFNIFYIFNKMCVVSNKINSSINKT